ncbi:MAG: hypothetical protein KatS3mg003_0045 [Candidatus Nitrosocaldaceae archaeon]|nr:MAG: hypothetical protein KatS3mg003_0045 [Candidatus Nitrosocaldaceae archaeon]
MRITIHQPNFLPYPGFFLKVYQADILVIGDSVQYSKKGFTNRNKIKTQHGAKWLSVPIIRNLPQTIDNVLINNMPINGKTWNETHLNTLRVNYSKAKFYDKYIDDIRIIYNKEWKYLAEFNLGLIKHILFILGIKKDIILLSSLNVEGKSSDLIVNICKKLGADEYISGIGGKNYLDEKLLESNSIKLFYSKFNCPEYEQQFPQLGFIPNLSIIDMLFNVGSDTLKLIVENGELLEN